MLLKQARIAILPAAALAAAGLTGWVDSLRGIDVGRDDLCPAVLTIILSFWALLAHFYRKFWRDTRKVQFERTVAAVAEGVRAEMQGRIAGDGDGQHAPSKGR